MSVKTKNIQCTTCPRINLSELLLVDIKHDVNDFYKDCVVFFENDDLVKVAIWDEEDIPLLDFLYRFFSSKKIKIFITDRNEIDFFKYKSIEESSVIKEANKYIITGIKNKASDVHFKAEEKIVKVYFRVNGDLIFYESIPKDKWSNIKRRYKIIAKLNIADELNPQSGAAKIQYVDFCNYLRISVHPGIFGENITIRIQQNNFRDLNLEKLGLDNDIIKDIRTAIKYQRGLFILSGPVGVGKTTTIYSILKEISNKNIMTIEDPVEIIVPEFKQMDINEKGNLTYDECIKSSLRHDPDVLLIGEIRDSETANAAIRAALTGKLVFTTVHAFDAIEVLYRLVELDIDINYLLSNLNTIMSQRLLRYKGSNKRFAVAEIINLFNIPKGKIFNTIHEVKEYIGSYITMREKSLQFVKDDIIDEDEIIKNLGLQDG